MVIKPAGYAIWENIQQAAGRADFKAAGVENVYMPMFIPESLLQKEKDHVEGFAPEVAWVTYGGWQKLQERLCVRPTSETLFCDFYKNDIQSYRDLPKVYNQWCSVVRWEKDDPSVPAFQRVPVAGRPYGTCNCRRSRRAYDPDAECICGFLLSRYLRFR